MVDDREDRIRERARALWESEGRPDGLHEEHWRRASEEPDGAPDGDAGPLSLGSAAQSELIPADEAGGPQRTGSLVDTGPALGLVAGSPGAGGTGGGSAALGSLSPSQEERRGGPEGAVENGGIASTGSQGSDASSDASRTR